MNIKVKAITENRILKLVSTLLEGAKIGKQKEVCK